MLVGKLLLSILRAPFLFVLVTGLDRLPSLVAVRAQSTILAERMDAARTLKS